MKVRAATGPRNECGGDKWIVFMKNWRGTILLAVVGMVLAMPVSAKLNAPEDKYVRTAVNFMRAGSDITPATVTDLAKFDLVVLPAEAQNFNPTLARDLRKRNPNITILAYVPTKSYNDTYWTDALHLKLKSGIEASWWLLDPVGNPISVWPGTRVISTVSPWQNYLPQFVRDEIMSTGYWDGVFYDELSANASWMNGGDIDLHREGSITDPNLLDAAWKRATINMLRRTRELLGPDAVIVTNGDSTGELQPYVNGRMFEAFPTPWEAGGTWGGVMTNYLNLHRQVAKPAAFIVGAVSDNAGSRDEYKKMRYSLASTLMGDGFFGFASSMSDYGNLWWYDEYDVRLGRPTGSPVNLLAPYDRATKDGVWRRDFENGVVVVNSTGQDRLVNFAEELEKLKGSQDPDVNDGSRLTSVTLPARDGLVLLKRQEQVTGAPFFNGGFVRLFGQDGRKIRNGFFSYVAPFPGGAAVVVKDLDGDGTMEKVGAAKGEIRVIDADGRLRASFRPFGPYIGAINIAVADVNGDKKLDIISGAGPGGGPHIVIHAADGTVINKGFFAFDKSNRGGVFVAAADFRGTGWTTIVAGSGQGLTPQVKLFDTRGNFLSSFYAYDYNFRGGVRVAAADFSGDGKSEIVTAPGPGGGPHVRVFTQYGRPLSGFMAATESSRAGLYITAGDLDGDGRPEIATLTTDVFQAMR